MNYDLLLYFLIDSYSALSYITTKQLWGHAGSPKCDREGKELRSDRLYTRLILIYTHNLQVGPKPCKHRTKVRQPPNNPKTHLPLQLESQCQYGTEDSKVQEVETPGVLVNFQNSSTFVRLVMWYGTAVPSPKGSTFNDGFLSFNMNSSNYLIFKIILHSCTITKYK